MRAHDVIMDFTKNITKLTGDTSYKTLFETVNSYLD